MTSTSERKELHWLLDMREAIEKIEKHPQYARGRQAFEQDEFFQVWIFYYMERIGECASHLRREYDYDNKHPEIDWRGTVGMRRHLIHWYWTADYDKVWEGVEYLPKIKEKLAALIKERTE